MELPRSAYAHDEVVTPWRPARLFRRFGVSDRSEIHEQACRSPAAAFQHQLIAFQSSGALPMVMERNSRIEETRLLMARSIGEIKDAVRALRETTPDSVLAQLAEQKIETIEKGRDSSRNRYREDRDTAAACED
ncbi:hypothetical protein [Microvirga pakistanensis]|uniref:hypothetical protein n=1 Tax=Microvirga pakistanensis TaxID=1682650 RepID=UPI00106B5EA8|nr:hypothetical protein [Microvirga pakistanensis]